MRKKGKKVELQFGSLIEALFDEVSQITTDESLQISLVCLALQDLKRQYKGIPDIQKESFYERI